MSRLKTFAKAMGMGEEESRAWVDPLVGLDDVQFIAHLEYLADRKDYVRGKVNAPAAVVPKPATDVVGVQAQVVDFMSDLLDTIDDQQMTTNASSLPVVDDLTGVGRDISDYFAAIETEDDD